MKYLYGLKFVSKRHPEIEQYTLLLVFKRNCHNPLVGWGNQFNESRLGYFFYFNLNKLRGCFLSE